MPILDMYDCIIGISLEKLLGARLKTSKGLWGRLDHRGQAVLEYILVLAVTVAIILGVMYQFSDAFKKYVASYFGDYVACLLETGEMPSLGGDSGATASICNSEFEPFSIASGRPLSGNGVGNGSGDRSSAAARRAGESAARGRSRRSGSAGFTSTGNTTRNGENFRRRGGRSRYSPSDSTGSSENKQSLNLAQSEDRKGYRAQQMYRQGRSRLGNRFSVFDEKRSEKGGFFTKQKITAKTGETIINKRLPFDPKKLTLRRNTASTSLSLDLSVSDYIRYIIVFGIIIAIVIFFGGQIAQLRKSWEK
ncbi:MAG: hypothetical protein K2Q26_09470 [Bdellovibrionales bacterium]|nr:hypothetical protein [Bdellovibrionales bacterium]